MTRTLLMDTQDVDEARLLVGRGYTSHRLSVAGRADSFHAVQNEWRVGQIRVHRLRYSTELTIEADALVRSVLVTRPVRGSLAVRSGGTTRRYGPGAVIALGPDTPFSLGWSADCELSTVQIDRRLLESALGPHEDVDLAAQHCATGEQATTWTRLTRLLEANAAQDDPTGLLTANLEAFVAGTVLSNHARPAGYAARESPRSLRAAIEFVEVHADRPLTAGDIAAEVHVSVRGLQAGLRRFYDTTPTELLRAVRLTRAHRDLVAADPTTCTVADVAYRWGFGNPGRFARYYAARYGVPPSQTLRE